MDMQMGATISKCQQFRYSLTRVWDEDKPRCMIIGLNPSTADHREDDNTIRRCIGFAKGFGYGGFEMLNLFAFRSRHPKNLSTVKDPVGPLNISAVLSAAKRCAICIAAWGVLARPHSQVLDYERRTLAMLSLITTSGYHPQVYCLGMTTGGYPRHPLFLRGDTPLQVYSNPRLENYQARIERRRRNKAS
jgi:hypothetical protein